MYSNIKNLYICVFICGFLLLCGQNLAFAEKSDVKEHYYALTTIVVKIDNASNVVTCQDFNGNLWEFHGIEDWQKGDIASLLMYDNGTEEIFDDCIVCAYYDGWLEDFLTDHLYQ